MLYPITDQWLVTVANIFNSCPLMEQKNNTKILEHSGFFCLPIVILSRLINDWEIQWMEKRGEKGDESWHSAQMLLQSESFSSPLDCSPILVAASVSSLQMRGTQQREEFKDTASLSSLSWHFSNTYHRFDFEWILIHTRKKKNLHKTTLHYITHRV